jgi:hypothetical protein
VNIITNPFSVRANTVRYVTDFRLSRWLIINIKSVPELLCSVVLRDAADVWEVHADSIFRVEVRRLVSCCVYTAYRIMLFWKGTVEMGVKWSKISSRCLQDRPRIKKYNRGDSSIFLFAEITFYITCQRRLNLERTCSQNNIQDSLTSGTTATKHTNHHVFRTITKPSHSNHGYLSAFLLCLCCPV